MQEAKQNPLDDERPYVVTVAELQHRTRSSKTRVYEWIAAGEVCSVKLGRKTLIVWSSVEALIERNTVRRSVG